MRRVILITSDEVRHIFFSKFIASSNKYETVKTYVETDKKNDVSNELKNEHLLLREQTERDFRTLDFMKNSFEIKEYQQVFSYGKGFYSNLSMIDLLMNEGPFIRNWILSNRN